MTIPQVSFASEFCDIVYKISKSTMNLRQEGLSLRDHQKFAEEQGRKSVIYKEVKKIVLYDAYKIPIYENKGEKEIVAEEFAKVNYKACMKSVK